MAEETKVLFQDYLVFARRTKALKTELKTLDLSNKMHVRRADVIQQRLRELAQEVAEYQVTQPPKERLRHLSLREPWILRLVAIVAVLILNMLV